MGKSILKKIFVILALVVLMSVPALAADTGDRVEIGENGEVTVSSDHAGKEEISSIQLSLMVEPAEPGVSVSFSFADTPAKIAEYRYHEEDGVLNLYLAGTESLFADSDSLKIGTVVNGEGNPLAVSIRVVEDSLKYVYGTEVRTMSVDGELEPPTEEEPGNEPGPGPVSESERRLRETLETATAFSAGDYTGASYQVLKTAMAEAEAVLADPERTEDQILEALMNLENAIGALERIAGTSVGNNGSAGSGTSLGTSANTGDQTKILPYVVLLIAAILLVSGLILFLVIRGRRNKNPFGTRGKRGKRKR